MQWTNKDPTGILTGRHWIVGGLDFTSKFFLLFYIWIFLKIYIFKISTVKNPPYVTTTNGHVDGYTPQILFYVAQKYGFT